MIDIPSFVLILITIVISYYGLRILDHKFGSLFRPVPLNDNTEELRRLKSELESQRILFIAQLKAQADEFERKMKDQRESFEAKIRNLEQHNAFLMERLITRERAEKTEEYVDQNKMLFVSCDEQFYARDRTALFRAGLKFTTLRRATSAILTRELRKGREGGRPYHLVVVSAHGTGEGIMLADGLKPGDWFARNFFGVEVALFAACQSFQILDDLTGIVTYSIGMMDDIETELAEDFIYIFWREYIITKNPIQAFENVKRIMPELSDRVTIRYTE